MVAQYTRQTAVPCTLSDITSGSWMQNDGLVPSGVMSSRGMISRASVIGVIIEKRADGAFIMEDGTATILVRSFDTKPVEVRANVGDIVLVIGRPREYNSERYMVLEICKKLRNPGWVQYRKEELALLNAMQPAETLVVQQQAIAVQETVQVMETEKNPFETIVQRVRELDSGNGADIEEIVAGVPGGDKFVRTLIEEGEIFEIRPGKLKVLE